MLSATRNPTGNHGYAVLLRDPGFHSFLWTQFLGAFNDNVYKMIVSVGAVEFAANHLLGARYLAIAGAVFVLPFMLFAGYAGQLADRFSKTRVLQVTKSFEIVIMLAGLFALAARNIDMLLVVLFLLALQANFFSPAKYGILPEMLPEAELSRANGLLELSTFAAIILGTSVGSFLFARWKDEPVILGGILLTIAVLGSLTSLLIRKVRPSGSRAPLSLNPFGEIWAGTKRIARERALWLTVAGNSYFWFIGALFQLTVILFGKETLHLSETHTGLLVTALAIGIGTGSIAAGWLSGDHIEIGLIPCGAFLLGSCSIALGFAHSWAASLIWLAATGFAAGLYIVPLNAYLQESAGSQEKGRVLATNSFWNAVGMVMAAGLLWLLHDVLGWTPAGIFAVIGVATLAATVYIAWVVPAALVRFAIWALSRIFFRVRVVGRENLPTASALLVANHVSYVDAILLGSITPQLIRFVMWQPLYDNPWLKPICRLFDTIPLPHRSPKEALRALRQARTGLAKGELVCIFPEGGLTTTGQVQPFERGVELIARGCDVTAIVPIYLEGLWGHTASLKGGRAFASWPRLRDSVTIVIGKPMSADTTASQIRDRVLELGANVPSFGAEEHETLATRFVRTARRNWSRPAIADSTGKSLTSGQTLTAAFHLSQWLRRHTNETHIGLLLPASAGGAVANIAVALAGRAAVNLNFTAGPDHLRQAIDTCGIRTILSSHAFAEKIGLTGTPGIVYLEELPRPNALSLIKARLLPARLLTAAANPTDVAAVIFSSGSTGTPKGVMLSHRNLLANTKAASDVCASGPADCMLGALPFFHSFGFTYTLWFPLLHGFRAVFHSNPADAKIIGELAAAHKATFFLSTPTFCLSYLRRCAREQFATIRCFLVGAEKLRPALAEAFQEKFGITLLEGYGCTEMGPVISVNVPEALEPGSAGRPLPNVSVRVVDPETFAPLRDGGTGLLLVNGPSRMIGYLNDADRTANALHDGYYITGDLGFVDDQGYLHVVDRLARFSKIAGEMVPHGKIEDALNTLLGPGRSVVTGIPDDRRGEALIILYTGAQVTPRQLIAHLESAGLRSLWIPKADAFLEVESIPTLATGKVDLQRVKAMASGKVEVTA